MSGFERADWTDLIETERMLAVGLSGAEIAVFARFSVQTNALLVRKWEKTMSYRNTLRMLRILSTEKVASETLTSRMRDKQRKRTEEWSDRS